VDGIENQTAPKVPFDRGYPELRDPERLDKERTEVDKQVGHLVRLGRDPEYLAGFVAALTERRRNTALVQFAPITRDDGALVYVAAGSYLLRGGIDADETEVLRRELGLNVVETGAETGLVRLEPGPSFATINKGRSTTDVFELLRTRRNDVAFNHLVPLGGVMKAEGGPEPTALHRPFPAVPIPSGGVPPRVAVIDTGVSVELRSDDYLRNLVQSDNIDPLDAFPPPHNGLLDAAAGHGSFVAGVIQQVAPSARLRVYKVTDSDGVCTDQQIGDAIRQAGNDGADIINLSLGTTTTDGTPPPAMLDAVQGVIARNPEILLVVAAGNDGNETPMWPAALSATGPHDRFDNVVAVAGLTARGCDNDWSSRGPWVTCSTVGQGVSSTYVIGTEDGPLIKDDHPDTYGPDAWAVWTGTSFAAPQITGGVARLCHENGLTPRAALRVLLDGAPDDLPGWGRRVQILPGT